MNESRENTRKLAAIIFTDIVGFTEISANDEPAAFKLLETQRKLLKPIVKNNNGEWLKEIGDGLLLTFSTNHDAVNCAIEIQTQAKSIDGLSLRIGIHQGEVIFSGNDIIGDDVNIASRIEAFSAPGGIAISDRVNAGLERDPDYETVYIGKPKLKGVKQKIEIFCIISHDLKKTDINQVSAKLEPEKKSITKRIILPLTGVLFTIIGAVVWFIFPLISFTTASSRDYDKKIAVLYFDNKGTSNDDYISEGITQEIIAKLSKIKNLSVASRFDIAGYSSKTINLDEIKNKLNLDFLVTGFIRKIDAQINISAELIDLDSREVSWAETYKKNVEDIFEIQKEVALNVVSNLDIELNSGDTKSLLSDPSQDNTAYDMLLKAKFNAYELNMDTLALQEMVSELDLIVKKDSTFSEALATRAFTRFLLFNGKQIKSRPDLEESQKYYDLILKDANRALRYDSNNFVATSIYPFTNLLKLSLTNSPTEIIILGRKALVGVNEMIELAPNHYLSQFIKGMYHQLRAYSGLINSKDDYSEAVFYLHKSNNQTRSAIENNIADPMVKMIFERGTWWLAELHRRYEYFSELIILNDELITLHGNDHSSKKLKKNLRRKGYALISTGYFDKSIDNYIKLNEISGDDIFHDNLYKFYSITQLANSYIRLNQYKIGFDILIDNPPSIYYADWGDAQSYKSHQYELYLGEAYVGLGDIQKSNNHLIKSISGIQNRMGYYNSKGPNFKYSGTTTEELVKELGQYSLIPKSILALNKSMSKNNKDVEVLIREIIEEIDKYGIPDSFTYFKILSCLAKAYQNIGDSANLETTLNQAIRIKHNIAEKLNDQDRKVFNNNVPSDKRLRPLFNLN